MSWLDRLRSRRAQRALERTRESTSAPDAYERELVEHDVGGMREDTFVAGGDGALQPGLPASTPRGLYEDLDHDEEAPEDRAP